MKKTIFTIFAMTILLASCSNDDDSNSGDGIMQQPHNSSELMTRMHTMMTEMDAMTMTDDPDLDFANMMIMHHQGAINMANLELEDGDNATMKSIAQNIIDEQQQEIMEMQQIVSGLTADEEDMGFYMELMSSMEKMGITADTQILTGDTDRDFATLMIVHHQSALDNASAYLHHGSNPELLAMANMMVEMQTQEIIELGTWLINN